MNERGERRDSRFRRWILHWFDASVAERAAASDPRRGVDPKQAFSLVFLHAGCLLVPGVGWSPFAVATAVALYALRAFFVTAFYHRYLSHRAFKTSRPAQLVFAALGGTAVQRGPLWWAAHHRQHHSHTEQEGDPHSPHRDGFLWSHIGWITARENFPTKLHLVPDLARFPELRWLDRFDLAAPAVYAAALFAIGAVLARVAPGLGTDGPQLLVWGFFVSTVILFHVTSLVNSGAHSFGRKRYPTRDESRNSFLIALLTMGEGWHNNHHHYPGAARNGFFWWELDVTYYALRLLGWLGVVWDLNPVPRRALVPKRAAVPEAS